MELKRKDKKRMTIYGVGAAAATMRGAISTGFFVTNLGIQGGSALSTMMLGSALAFADELCGVHSQTHVGDELTKGLQSILAKSSHWTQGTLNKGVTLSEKWIKQKIQQMR